MSHTDKMARKIKKQVSSKVINRVTLTKLKKDAAKWNRRVRNEVHVKIPKGGSVDQRKKTLYRELQQRMGPTPSEKKILATGNKKLIKPLHQMTQAQRDAWTPTAIKSANALGILVGNIRPFQKPKG